MSASYRGTNLGPEGLGHRAAADHRLPSGSRPRLLDLFCGAGGAAMGYARAGFEVVGVDIKPQPNYPFAFIKADALTYLAALIGERDRDAWPDMGFDAIHASPPCQAMTTMSNRWRGAGGQADEHVNLIPETRELLEATGLPWVIENVPGARAHLRSPVVLNGPSCGLLRLDRPRLFETNWPLMVPSRVPAADPIGVYGKAPDGRLLFRRANGTEQRAAASTEEGGEVMGINWMEWSELKEAIPPAYTQLIGEQLAYYLEITEPVPA